MYQLRSAAQTSAAFLEISVFQGFTSTYLEPIKVFWVKNHSQAFIPENLLMVFQFFTKKIFRDSKYVLCEKPS
jgi:hypothetical protein